ncbi:MAG: RpiB/LacA/LacB family sugar-phosphate isomerase [bacterium]
MPKAAPKTVYIAADHAAFGLKRTLRDYLERAGHQVVDVGPSELDLSDDYPDFVLPAAERVAAAHGRAVGIVMGGSGIGECIAANKVRGVRAALVYDGYTAKMSRQHNDANVICLGARTASGSAGAAKRLVGIWLKTAFSGVARHRRRNKKIADYEKSRVG